jgi:DNA-binding NarL/FixJ family response regulator
MSRKKRGQKIKRVKKKRVKKKKRATDLSPRLQETLELLLSGESEKQIAARLELSRHTVHEYVKALYKRFDVSTRAELLARWVRKKAITRPERNALDQARESDL